MYSSTIQNILTVLLSCECMADSSILVCMYVCMYVLCMYVCMYVYVCMCVCMCVNVCMCMYVCMYEWKRYLVFIVVISFSSFCCCYKNFYFGWECGAETFKRCITLLNVLAEVT